MSSKQLMPAFDRVRLATLSDLPRVATVAAAGFFHSPTFQFQRPRHAQYVEDTLSSYWTEYAEEIRDLASVVLVVEDVWNASEHEHTYEALRKSPMYCTGRGSQPTVVVGVCGIDLKPGSSRIGQFQPRAATEPSHPSLNALDRDFDAEALELYGAATAPAKAKYLAGLMRLSTLAVHPAYWRQGHANRLVEWCTSLADMDGVPVGISAAPMGATVAAKAGFEEKEVVRIRRSEVQGNPYLTEGGDVELWIAIRQPILSRSSSGTMYSDSPATDSQ